MTQELGSHGGDDVITDPGGVAATKERPLPPPAMVLKKRRPWYRRKLVVGVVVVALVAGGVTSGLLLTGSSSATYVAVPVGYGTVSQTVTATGTLQPVTSANVNFQVNGTVNSVLVSDGESITAGQKLATVGTGSLELDLEEAEANLAGAQATLSSDEASDASSASIESDNVQVSAAQSALTQARDGLDDATLTAPISGTVTTLDLVVGQSVTSTSGSGSSSAQVVIENLDQFEVSASVSVGSAGSVEVGDQAVITPSSSGSAPVVLGSVTSVSTVPTVSSGVASFPVVVTVTGSPSGIYAGTSANVSIVTAQRANVLVVPSSAVLDMGPNEYVEKLVHGDQVLTRVTTGLVGGSQTQITSGLASGDQVAVHVAGSPSTSGPGVQGPGGIFSPGGPNGKVIIAPGGGGFIQRSGNGP